MFKITAGRGFQIKFDNGWTVSVQFGPYNYCDNRDLGYTMIHNAAQEAEVGAGGCRNAEIAAWHEEGRGYDFGDDIIKGWVTPNELLKFLNKIASKTN